MIGAIENAIIEQIKAVSDANALGYKFRQIKTYGGEARSEKDRADIKDVPAAWLAFDGADEIQKTSGFHKFRGKWVLLVAVQNLRNERAGRHGAVGDVGAYQICVDMVSVLAGTRPGKLDGVEAIDNMAIKPLSVDESRNGRLAVYGIPFSVNFQIAKSSPLEDLTNPLEIIHTNWDLPPNGEVGPDLPDDEKADATSHITGE